MPDSLCVALLIESSTYDQGGVISYGMQSPHSIVWSPTGKQIAFAHMTHIVMANSDGTNVRQIIDTGHMMGLRSMKGKSCIEWSPCGKRIAFIEDKNIYIALLATDECYLLTEGYDFHWLADGKRLIYWNDVGAFVTDMRGEKIDKYDCLHGEISPDRQMVITNFLERVKISSIDGQNAYFLDCKLNKHAPTIWIDYAQWSPNGNKIAYSQTADMARIYTIDADGANQQYIAEGVAPKWSPDGEKIAFTDRFRKEAFVINIDGRNLKDIGHGHSVAWSPNSNKLLYSGKDGIHVVAL